MKNTSIVASSILAVTALIVAFTVYAVDDVKNSSLATNLSSYWELEETSSTRVDSHDSNDLTDNNTVLYGTGIQGNAADFESTDSESLSVAHNANLEPAGDYSLSLWFKPESLSGTRGVISKEGSGKGYTLYTSGTSAGYNHQGVGGCTFNGTLSTGTWYHLVVTFVSSSNTLSCYKNNDSPGTAAGVTYIDSAGAAFRIGGYNTASLYSDGLIDEVAFWKGTALSASDVASLYNSGAGIPYDAGGAAASATSTTPVRINGGSLRIQGGTFKNTQL